MATTGSVISEAGSHRPIQLPPGCLGDTCCGNPDAYSLEAQAPRRGPRAAQPECVPGNLPHPVPSGSCPALPAWQIRERNEPWFQATESGPSARGPRWQPPCPPPPPPSPARAALGRTQGHDRSASFRAAERLLSSLRTERQPSLLTPVKAAWKTWASASGDSLFGLI